jgi:hypothetical protein
MMYHILYLNGLSDGKIRSREVLAFNYLAKRDIQSTHAHVNWRSGESFEDLHDHVLTLAHNQLQRHGRVILVGSSAGGSLAINVFATLRHKNIFAVSLCGRLSPGNLPWWDTRKLERMAYLGGSKESQSFYRSVTHCAQITLPSLTEQNKQRVTIVKPWADFVVPRPTMDIDGTHIYTVRAIGHGMGIAAGIRLLPTVLDTLVRKQDEASLL